MKEMAQQKFLVYTRGVDVLLPPQVDTNSIDRFINVQESERLYQIIHDGTLHKRYPEANDGINKKFYI